MVRWIRQLWCVGRQLVGRTVGISWEGRAIVGMGQSAGLGGGDDHTVGVRPLRSRHQHGHRPWPTTKGAPSVVLYVYHNQLKGSGLYPLGTTHCPRPVTIPMSLDSGLLNNI